MKGEDKSKGYFFLSKMVYKRVRVWTSGLSFNLATCILLAVKHVERGIESLFPPIKIGVKRNSMSRLYVVHLFVYYSDVSGE